MLVAAVVVVVDVVVDVVVVVVVVVVKTKTRMGMVVRISTSLPTKYYTRGGNELGLSS